MVRGFTPEMTPYVSVVMAVCNGEKYLSDAVESILSQSFREFEFIIIDDGSTDATASILAQFEKRDARVLIHRFDTNHGLSSALNFAIQHARGEYIVRMDADDISFPNRLSGQVAYLDEHPEVGICGTWVELIGDSAGKTWKHPLSHEAISVRMLFANALVHSSVMLRRSVMTRHELYYDESIRYAQDYELWSRAMLVTRFANVGSILLQYRVYKTSSGAQNLEQQDQTKAIVQRRILSLLGVECTGEELDLHNQLSIFRYGNDEKFFHRARTWLEKLLLANARTHVFSPRLLSKDLGVRWTQICERAELPLTKLIRNILSSPLPFYFLRWLIKRSRLDKLILR